MLVFVCAVGITQAYAQNQGIGFRLGNPVGVTYKKYLQNNRAVEFGIGTASRGWNNNYYRNSFGRYSPYDNYTYRSHVVNSIVYFQARYLFQYEIQVQGMDGKLDWYWGLGGMLKLADVTYRYQNRQPPFNDFRDQRTDVDLGPEGIIGMEYKFEDVPISVFGEISLVVELLDQPGIFRTFGGAGIRFNF